MSNMVQGPPGTVAVIFNSDAARYSAFASDLEDLQLPPGSVKDFAVGPRTTVLLDDLVQRAIARDSYWIWFISEDHTFTSDAVASLLMREEAIVAPIVLEPEEPFRPQAMREEGTPLLLDSVIGPGTMIEVDAVTSPYGVLVRRAVFDALNAPWFTARVDGDGMTDICLRAKELDIQAFVDTSVRIGRRMIASVYPRYQAGKWELVTSVGSAEFSLPIKHR